MPQNPKRRPQRKVSAQHHVWLNQNTFNFPQKVGWGVVVDFRKQLYNLLNKEKPGRLLLDFRATRRAFPDGLVPLIADLDRLRTGGVEFQIRPPANALDRQFFENNGYLHFLDPGRWKLPQAYYENAYVLHRFTTAELNDVINRVGTVCLTDLPYEGETHEAFIYALNEIADNVLVHSEKDYGWVQVMPQRSTSKLSLVVCDSGVGIRRSISQALAVKTDQEAISQAIRRGVTRDPKIGQGNGLWSSLSIAQKINGKFTIVSGEGRLAMHDEGGRVRLADASPTFAGTVVTMELPTRRPFSFESVFGKGYKPYTLTEIAFEDEEHHIIVKLAEYASNFGNRPTGRQMRTLITNLMKANPGRVINVDMAGIPLVSSSFADETFGKLMAELGPTDFTRIVQIRNVSPVCKRLIDEAVVDRMAQIAKDRH